MTLRSDFKRDHPDFPLLSADDPGGLQSFLIARGWIDASETVVSSQRAGDGNMNLTLRIETERRCFVLKQARPWVEKYDEIRAPWDRSHVEQRFYERVRDIPGVGDRMPRLLHADPQSRVLVLETLDAASDLTAIYAGTSRLTDVELSAACDYLQRLHSGTRGGADALAAFANREMRALNHEHIFLVPVADENGLDLDAFEPGLQGAAADLRHDSLYRELLAETGERYLRDGDRLLHGDYFPGSWLRTARGLRVIDPEFAFPGDPEVDVGCALAHLALADQPLESARQFVRSYGPALEPETLARCAAAEVMRRLIGVAQLPLPSSPSGERPRAALLERSRDAMVSGNVEALWKS